MCYSINKKDVDEMKDNLIWFPSLTNRLSKTLKDMIITLEQRARIIRLDSDVIILSKEEFDQVNKIKNIFQIL